VSELTLHACRDLAELLAIHAAIGRQFNETWTGNDRRLDEPRRRFLTDRELMVAIADGEAVRGGVIAFGDERVTIRGIGVDAAIRGFGVGRRLLEIVEAQALLRGARAISLGAADDARGFYEKMGYRGRRAMREKQLPPPGAVRDRLVARARLELLVLDTGIPALRPS
jgi:GNAT superfamily N-acetyltransferase